MRLSFATFSAIVSESSECENSFSMKASPASFYCNLIWNLKRAVIWKLLVRFHTLAEFPSDKKLFWFLPASSRVSRAIVLNKLKNNLSKAMPWKQNRKGIEKRLNFVFLSSCHIKNDRIICHQVGTFKRPFICCFIVRLNEIFCGFSFSLIRAFEWELNGTFICVIEKTKGLKQSFIIESKHKNCGSTSRRKWRTKAENKNAQRDNEQLFTYSLHPKLQLYCLAVSNSCCLPHTQVGHSNAVVQCLDMINDSL